MSQRYLLDSDVCVALLKGADTGVRDRLLALPATQVAMCSVVRGELESGAWGSPDPYGRLARIERMFGEYASLPFDDGAAARYGQIAGALRRAGRDIGSADTMIAAIAELNDLTVVTRNLKHFKRVKGLKVVRW